MPPPFRETCCVSVFLFSLPDNESSTYIFRALGTQGLNLVQNKKISDTVSVCNSLQNISEKQKKLCKEFPDLLPSVALGARISINECKHQFKDTRWKCPVVNEGASVFGKILDKGRLLSLVFALNEIKGQIIPEKSCSLLL